MLTSSPATDLAFAQFAASVEPVLRVIDERKGGVTVESFGALVLAAGDVAAVVIDTPQTVQTSFMRPLRIG